MTEDNLPPGSHRISREEYVEMLTDSSLKEADEMGEGFGEWVQRHAPQWHEQGRDETWIRQRIASAQSNFQLHKVMREKGMTREQRRIFIRQMYTDMPEMYDMMIARERAEPHVSIIRGTTEDVLQRYTLRVLVYEADKASFVAFQRWAGLPPSPFVEGSTKQHIRDLSTVEELNMALLLAQYIQACCEIRPKLTKAQINARMDQRGKELRAEFIARYGYKPEESTTPRIPVTIDGAVDPDEYRRRMKDADDQDDEEDENA